MKVLVIMPLTRHHWLHTGWLIARCIQPNVHRIQPKELTCNVASQSLQELKMTRGNSGASVAKRLSVRVGEARASGSTTPISKLDFPC
jgi:hypothetical protein